MLGGARFQGRLLRQGDEFGHGGLTSVLILEGLRQLPHPGFDRAAPRREPPVHLRRDAVDLAHAPLARAAVGADETKTQLGQQALECGVVDLGGGHG